MSSSRIRRPLWFTSGAAIGLMTAVLTTQALMVSASADSAESTFVAIAPCRLLDTRPGSDNVGPRATQLSAGEELDVQVSGGNHGRCAIPTGATAISINITAVGASDPTFVAAYPADVVNPGTSSLNVVPGASPTPNEVDVQLSSDGAITLFNAHGTVDVIGDITGYYVAARIDDVESAVAALDGRLANVEDALGDVNTSLAATDATLSDIDGRLAATDATLSDIDGRLGAVESTPVSKTFEWHYQGTVTQAGGPTSIMSIPAGSTVTPVDGDFAIAPYFAACNTGTVVTIQLDGATLWTSMEMPNGSHFNTSATTRTLGGNSAPLTISATCNTGMGTTAVFSFGLEGSLEFRIEQEAVAFD